MKYVKRPIPVEAIQFNKLGDHSSVIETTDSPTGFGIYDLEHTKVALEVALGDYIVTGGHSDTWAVKKHIFEATYEPYAEV